jgi:hypothetical protein
MRGRGGLDVAKGNSGGGGDVEADEVLATLDGLHVGGDGCNDVGGEGGGSVLGGIKVGLEIPDGISEHAGDRIGGGLAGEGVHGLGEGIGLKLVTIFASKSGFDVVTGSRNEGSLHGVGEGGLFLDEGVELADKLKNGKGDQRIRFEAKSNFL